MNPHCINHGATFLISVKPTVLILHDPLSFRQQIRHSITSHEKYHTGDQYRVDVARISDLVIVCGDILWLDEHLRVQWCKK
jgi:hypothetical protein